MVLVPSSFLSSRSRFRVAIAAVIFMWLGGSASTVLAWQISLPEATLFGIDFDDQGNGYVGTQSTAALGWTLRRIGPDGDVLWAASGDGLGRAVRRCGEALVCTVSNERLSAFDIGEGALSWSVEIGYADALVTATGDIVAYQYVPSATLGSLIHSHRYDPDGDRVASSSGGRAWNLLAGNGAGVLAYWHTSGSMHVLGPGDDDDRVLLDAQTSPHVAAPSAHLDLDLNLVYLSRPDSDPDRINVVQVAQSGVNWTLPLLDLPLGYVLGPTVMTADADDTVYLLTAVEPDRGLPGLPSSPESVGLAFHQIAAISAGGELLWQRRFASDGTGDPWDRTESRHDRSAYVLVHGGSGRLLAAFPFQGGSQLMLRGFQADSGELAGMRVLACPPSSCDRVAAHIDDEDRVTVVTGRRDPQEQQSPGEVTLHGQFGLFSEAAVPVAQVGLSGPWYAPYVTGQGFTLRYHPDPGVLFMPWFTYTSEAGGPESLRWYVIEGAVDADADSAVLPILMRVGGVFDSGLAPPPLLVGEARLRFVSCNEGFLEYRFDPQHNDGAEGSMNLHRLLPLEDSCTRHDGEIVDAEADYDRLLTGSWYDPATAGQGIEVYRIASEESGSAPLFAAWYTFDTSPANGVAEDQHWFTLQLQEPGVDGGIRTTIVQTLGGRFDREPTGNAFRVGDAELLSLSCDRMRLSYAFDDDAVAGTFAGRSGQIELYRLGECL